MSHRVLLATLVTIAAVAAAPTGALADDRGPRVAVVVELTVDVDARRADAYGAALADALNRELVVDAVGGEDVSRRLPQGGLPDECLGDTTCVQDVARRLDADQLIFLVLVQVGGDVQVDATWVSAATGETLARPRVVVPSEARAVSELAAQAQRYLPDAAARTTSPQTIIVGGATETIPGRPRRMSVPAWIATGVAIAGLGVGAGLGLSVRSDYHRCERTPCSNDTLDGIGVRANLADASFLIGAGAAVVTAILYGRSGSPSRVVERAQPAVTPTVGGAVVSLAGRW